MTAFLYFYYYYNRSCLTNLRVSRISDRGRIGVWKDYLYRLHYRAWALANEPSPLHVENVWPKSWPLSRWVGFIGFNQTIMYQNFVCSLKILMFLFSINHTSIFHVLILPIEFSRTVLRSRLAFSSIGYLPHTIFMNCFFQKTIA